MDFQKQNLNEMLQSFRKECSTHQVPFADSDYNMDNKIKHDREDYFIDSK